MNTAKLAKITDIKELIDLMSDFYEDAGYRLNIELSKRAIRTLLADSKLGRVWLLEYSNQIAGYVVLTLVFSMEYGGLCAFVDDFFIRTRFRRLGLGRVGMEALLAECRQRGVRAVNIEVGRENLPAKEFYAAFGFDELNPDRQIVTLKIEKETSTME